MNLLAVWGLLKPLLPKINGYSTVAAIVLLAGLAYTLKQCSIVKKENSHLADQVKAYAGQVKAYRDTMQTERTQRLKIERDNERVENTFLTNKLREKERLDSTRRANNARSFRDLQAEGRRLRAVQ